MTEHTEQIAPEVLITIEITVPALDRQALGTHLEDLTRAALSVGGNSCEISVIPYDPEECE